VPTTGSEVLDRVPFNQISANRDQSRMGDYYIPKLEQKPIKSMLTAWDFPLNPAQELGDAVTVDGTPKYVWDQTIMQSLAAGVDVDRNTVTGGMTASNTVSEETFNMIQYLSGAEAKKILGKRLSVNVNAYKGTAGVSTTCRVYLFSGSSAAVFPDLTGGNTIGTLNAGGTFTLTEANWDEIPRSGLDTAKADLKTVITTDQINDGVDFGFNGWQIVDAAKIDDTDKFAIVATFYSPTINTEVRVESISLVPGDIPTRPAPQTFETVLQECEYYWEKSYENADIPGTDTEKNLIYKVNEVPALGTADTARVRPWFFSLEYRNIKVSGINTVTFYSKLGTVDYVSARAVVRGGAFPYPPGQDTGYVDSDDEVTIFWAPPETSTKLATYLPITTVNIYEAAGFSMIVAAIGMFFHYTVNARLGEAEYL
jgi:hypothetical protein